MQEVKDFGSRHRKKMKEKNEKKLKHLVWKFGTKEKTVWDMMTKEEKKPMGDPSLFREDGRLEGEGLRDPAVVMGEGEELCLTEEEKDILRLGPKFCIYKNLCEEEFEADLEETIMKVKWDMMGEELNGSERTSDDVAMEVLLGKKE